MHVDFIHIRINLAEGLTLNTTTLSDYELAIASHLVVPDDITVSWTDIAGLDSVVQELRESVVLPVRHRNLFATSQLWQAPKGVLLHGPPGKSIRCNSMQKIILMSTSFHSLCPALTVRMRQDIDSEGHRQRGWNAIRQSGCSHAHRQMVWRISEIGLGCVLIGQKNSAMHYIYRWNRFVLAVT